MIESNDILGHVSMSFANDTPCKKVGILYMPFKSSYIYKSGNRHLSKLHKVVFKKVVQL